jgi:cytochrome c oxidase cbb3-type subunit 3
LKFVRNIFAIALCCVLAGCEREKREFQAPASSIEMASGIPTTDFRPGGAAAPTNYVNQSEERSYDLSQGKEMFERFNCVGCHAHGGGDKGPALMDDKWIYGYKPDQIYASIVQGRPNGMPAFGGKIPESELWKIVAYVRSLSGFTSKSVANGRSDHMSGAKPENSLSKPNPKQTTEP